MAIVVALSWLVGLVVAPLLIWHEMLADVLSSFHWSLSYVISELSPWFLLLVGICFLVPVAVSAGLHPESRWYPRSRRAYIAWGTVVYLLGLILILQVDEVWHYAH
jgi:hypothetical protein